MNKITAIAEKNDSKKIDAFLKKNDIKKVFKNADKNDVKYEFVITALKTNDIIEELKKIISNHGFITVNPTNLVYPCVEEKCAEKNLEELIMKGAKNFALLDKNFILFIICASIIACIGFQIDSVVALISAMIISPLMSPIMASSYAIINRKKNLIKKGLKIELLAIALILFISIIMSFFPNPSLSFEISMANTNLIYSCLISLIIGIVSANAFITGKYEALTGAAVGISLLPPITNAVILFASTQIAYSLISIFSFMINLLGMHLSSAAFFLIYKE